MGRPKAPDGTCRICGTYGPLTFDHVPPEKAFNDHPVMLVPWKQAWELMPDDPRPKGRQQQRGMGGHTLCGNCNNNTGSWYGNGLVEFCFQARELLAASDGKPTLVHLYHCYPLRVLKQVVTMFFSINGVRLHKNEPDLVRFVLGMEQRFLSPRYRFFIYYNHEGRLRSEPLMAKLNVLTGTRQLLSEITFPPCGYLFTIDSPPPAEVQLFEISHWARYGYHEFASVQLQLANLPTWSPVAGDYPDREEFINRARQDGEGTE